MANPILTFNELEETQTQPTISIIKPPGCMKYNPDCICGWKMKRIYANFSTKSGKRYRSKPRPIGWSCLKCGYTEIDSLVPDPTYYSRTRTLVQNQAKQTALLEASR